MENGNTNSKTYMYLKVCIWTWFLAIVIIKTNNQCLHGYWVHGWSIIHHTSIVSEPKGPPGQQRFFEMHLLWFQCLHWLTEHEELANFFSGWCSALQFDLGHAKVFPIIMNSWRLCTGSFHHSHKLQKQNGSSFGGICISSILSVWKPGKW